MTRLRNRRLIAGLLACSLLPLTAAMAADYSGPMRLLSFEDVVLDEQAGRLLLSTGRSGSEVLVTDLSGVFVKALPVTAPTGMVMTPDGTSVWVASSTTGSLQRIDTTTLTVVQTIGLPTGQCPGDVAVVGTRLVYGHSCNQYGDAGGYGGPGGIGVVDVNTGASHGNVTTGPFYRPVVSAGPAGKVYAADSGLSSTALSLYDVTGAAPVLVAERASACENLRDLSASPDGQQVVTSCGWPYRHDVFSADKLTTVGSYASASYPLAGAWSADGGTFSAGVDSSYGSDVYVYLTGSTAPIRVTDFGQGELLQPRGLAMARDGSRVWAVTKNSYGYALRVLDVPGDTTPSMTLAADPPEFFLGQATDVGGWLSSAGAGVPGAQLQVTRAGTGASPVALPPVTTRADGTFVFNDSPPATGDYTYTARWAGDATRSAVSATTSVTVRPLGTELQINAQAVNGRVDGWVLLSYSDNASLADRTVQLTRVGGGLIARLPDLRTDAFGGAKFVDQPATSGPYTYTASVAADTTHPAATTSTTVDFTAPPAATTLTASAPTTAYVGAALPVSGSLTAPNAVAGATVSVARSGCGAWAGTTTTSTTGTWSVTDPSPLVGTCTYKASYAGSSSYQASTASTSTTVIKRTSTLTLSAIRGTGSAKKLVYVTAHLSSWHTNRTVVIKAITGGKTVTLASAPVDAKGDLKVTHQPKTTTTYRAEYAGDDWYSPANAQQVL